MPDFEILEITIGLILVYLVLALAGTAINEFITNLLSWRARGLRTGIENLLQDEELAQRFYAHPLLLSLRERRRFWSRRKWPSYLTSEQFSRVLLDVVGARTTGEGEVSLDLPEDSSLRRILDLLAREAKKSGGKFEAEVEKWFDSGMERVASWFRGRMQWVSVVVGLTIAAVANADTIQLATDLAMDAELRQAVLERAEELTSASAPTAQDLPAGQAYDESVEEIERLGFSLGWQHDVPRGTLDWLSKIVGLVITGFAVSLGAPFWFDLLKKFASVRSAKKPEEVKTEKGGEDS